jgi:hypothetical protein
MKGGGIEGGGWRVEGRAGPGKNPGTGTAYVRTALPTVAPHAIPGSGFGTDCEGREERWRRQQVRRPRQLQAPHRRTSVSLI